jgi:hypothetical protein
MRVALDDDRPLGLLDDPVDLLLELRYSQPFWSNCTGCAGTSSARPFVAFTTTATFWMPPSAATTRSPRYLASPQTALSLVTATVSAAGGVPAMVIAPRSAPPSVTGTTS